MRRRQTLALATAFGLATSSLLATSVPPATSVTQRQPVTRSAAAQPLSPNLPPNCPAATYPPGAPYGVQFSGVLTSAVTVSQTPLGFPLTLPGVTAAFCGLLQLGFDSSSNTPTEVGTVVPANLVFSPATAYLGAGRIPTTVFAASPSSTSTPTVVSSQDPRLNLALSGAVTTQSALLGINCQIGPLKLTLSTIGAGGVPLSGPLSGATATLVASGFTVPPVSGTGLAGTCPDFLGTQINNLIGLPNNHTSLVANVTIHLCNSPVPACSLPSVPGAAVSPGTA